MGIAVLQDIEEVRAGARVLGLFESPLHAKVLRAHADGPCRLSELQGRVGWWPEATVRGAVKNLCECAGLVREKVEGQRNGVATALGPAGPDLLRVANALERWLCECPPGPIELESDHAKVAVKALSCGWSSSLMRALGTEPTTLTELSNQIPEISYPALERRIAWMRATGQVEALPRGPRGTPYAATDWLRRAIAPLAIASRCERRHMESPPVAEVEVETGFLLSLPMAPPPERLAGTCMMAVQTDAIEYEGQLPLAGVTVEVEPGQPISCDVSIEAEPVTWVVGTVEDWLDATIDGRFEVLRLGGTDPQLAADLLSGMRLALFIDR